MTQHQTGDIRNGMPSGSALEAVLHQAETWSKAQCELVSGIEAMCGRLMQWQREAIDAAAQSVAAISKAHDLGNVVQVQQQWLADATRRSESHWSELVNEAARLPWRVVRVEPTGEQPRNAPPWAEQQAKENAPSRREAAE